MIIEVTVDIDATPQRVWDVMADVERWSEWTDSINSIRFVDQPQMQFGSKLRIRQPNLPPAVWQVTAVRPGAGFTWEAKGPGLRAIASHYIETVAPDRSRVTLRFEQTGFIAGVMALLAEKLSRRYINMEAQGLKKRSEELTADEERISG